MKHLAIVRNAQNGLDEAVTDHGQVLKWPSADVQMLVTNTISARQQQEYQERLKLERRVEHLEELAGLLVPPTRKWRWPWSR